MNVGLVNCGTKTQDFHIIKWIEVRHFFWILYWKELFVCVVDASLKWIRC